MKKLFSLVVLMSLFASAPAFAWIADARIGFNRVEGQAVVNNYFAGPIMCSGQVVGQTYYGPNVYAWMNRVVIYPGQFGYANVYTNWNNPFVNVWAQIDCAYL